MRHGGSGRVISVVVLVLLAAGWGWSSNSTPPFGLVTDVVGKASVKQGESAWRPLALLAWVSSGSRVRVEAGSRVSVTTSNGVTRLHLAGPCDALLDGSGCRLLTGGASQLRVEKSPEAAAVPLPTGINLDRMGGRRRALLEWTMDPASLDAHPVLTWQARSPFQEFEVQVEEARSHRRVLRLIVPGSKSEAPLPPDVALIPGADYVVYLTGFQANGARVPSDPQPYALHIVDTAKARQIQAAHTRAMEAWRRSQEDVSPMSCLFWLYAGNGLYKPAAEVARILEKARPDDTGLREFLEIMRQDGTVPPRSVPLRP